MSENTLTEIDVFEPSGYDWSVRLGRFFYENGAGRNVRHYYLLLIEGDTKAGRILDELHFKAVDQAKVWGHEHETSYADALRPDIKLLGAESYVKTNRSLKEVDTLDIAHGLPWDMLHIWNCAARIGIAIDNLRHPFGPEHNCRTGAQAVLESLGLPVLFFPDAPDWHKQPTKIASDIFSLGMPSAPDGKQLLAEFRYLHKILKNRKLARTPGCERKSICEPS